MLNRFLGNDTICALASPHGMGAIALVRVSGSQAFPIVAALFQHKGKLLETSQIASHKAYHGHLINNREVVDEVVVTFFKAPYSFTGEDTAEINAHGSVYVQQKILEVLIAHGCRMAEAGEFTRRAFVNGKFDLAQAEAIADLISSENEAAHRIAINQLKGGFSKELQVMRSKLLEMTSLIELELDFSEEDVEFADRSQLMALLKETLSHVNRLKDSFRFGNAIKNGIPVAIVGQTNVGKSTLLNALLDDDRAIVSDIAGTTRDTIEETLNINGTMFRFIDTAGIRETDEAIEKIGIERTFRKISEANIVLGMIDGTLPFREIKAAAETIIDHVNVLQQKLLLLINKSDVMDAATMSFLNDKLPGELKVIYEKNIGAHGGYMADEYHYSTTERDLHDLHSLMKLEYITAKNPEDVEHLKHEIAGYDGFNQVSTDAVLVTNVRHYEALLHASESLLSVQQGLETNVPIDLVSQDLREALYYLGTITGEITTDEVLGTIFSRFCIGK
ncbi:MAG: tRNA uridine-5-carboxymethylaminomethyl(34) synthesis GTPase MnmE [Bacteroidales bacterium]|nr:tRNA uridine-5-carboxymethylaminomethyl(34) synthesis GTPase MnmE [Bacteroidales bacterium]